MWRAAFYSQELASIIHAWDETGPLPDTAHEEFSKLAAALGYRLEKIVSAQEAHEAMIAKRVAEENTP